MKKHLICCFLALFVTTSAALADSIESASPRQSCAPRTLAVLDFDLTGDVGDPSLKSEHEKRLAALVDQLRADLGRSGAYTVVDNGPAAQEINALQASQNLSSCNGCERDIGKKLGADYVMIGEVFRMSNLVLSLHITIERVADGMIMFKRVFDYRGDYDAPWRRAATYAVEYIKERASEQSCS